MTIEDLRVPPTNPPVLPWWPWLVYLLMACGIGLAGLIYARQGWHIVENEDAHRDVRAIAVEVGQIKAEVNELRAFTRKVEERAESSSEANRRRIESIEGNAP